MDPKNDGTVFKYWTNQSVKYGQFHLPEALFQPSLNSGYGLIIFAASLYVKHNYDEKSNEYN